MSYLAPFVAIRICHTVVQGLYETPQYIVQEYLLKTLLFDIAVCRTRHGKPTKASVLRRRRDKRIKNVLAIPTKEELFVK
eukprot:scaffold1404_cov166-Amphora_coffeaeformis.AAC.25